MPDKRTAYGFILASIVDGEPRYLLMRSASHGTWGAPKGHAEEGEEPFETALRETEEETGIASPNVIDGFERSYDYEVDTERGTYLKHVTYWLATVPEPKHTPSSEHDKSDWYDLDTVLELLQYEQMKQVFREADAYLRAHFN